MNLSTFSLAVFTLLGVVSFSAFPVSAHHCRLYEPPARSTMWRSGFNTPINYNDNELNCGGLAHQVSQGYKCGICGDPYDGERLHEAGGLYATGTIARTYSQGQNVLFQVEITANHKGYFEFRICPTNSPDIKATKECLDQNLLVLNNGDTRHYIDFDGAAMVNVTVRLPVDLTCDFCTLQWRYHTGNSLGTDPDGTSCLGCGYQEEFYGCADVRILAQGNGSGSGSSVPTSSSQPSSSTATNTSSTLTTSTTTTTTSGASSTSNSASTPSDGPKCRSHSGEPALNRWCVAECATGKCPFQYCACGPQPPLSCVAIGAFSDNYAVSKWCLINCGRGFCPVDMCYCAYGRATNRH